MVAARPPAALFTARLKGLQGCMQETEVVLKITTSRFGELEIDDSRIITFSEGILGFPNNRRYVLLERDANSPFRWLQSLESGDLAFVVVDPLCFLPDYHVEISPEDAQDLGIQDPKSTAVLCIVTIGEGGASVTANLLGPIVINPSSMRARQIVLDNTQYSIHYDLLAIAPRARAAGAP